MRRTIKFQTHPGQQIRSAYKVLKWFYDFSIPKKFAKLKDRTHGEQPAALACLDATISTLECLADCDFTVVQRKHFIQVQVRVRVLKQALVTALHEGRPVKAVHVTRCLYALTSFRTVTRRHLSSACTSRFGDMGLTAISLWRI